MIGIHGRAEEASSLAGHGVVLALGLLLVAPVVLARHPQAGLAASAWQAAPAALLVRAPRSLTAFEQIGNGHADEGQMGSTDPVVAPGPSRPAVSVGGLAFAPQPGTGGIGVQAIYDVFGSSPGLAWALRVAHCESRYNPLAVNAQSGASGLFQFMPSTWNAHFAGWNIWDPYAQARAALNFYNQGALNAWACK